MRQKLLCSLWFGLFLIGSVSAQTKSIRGKVTSADGGAPIAGVSISIQGTTIGTSTDGSGNYTLNVPEDAKELSFRFIGYESQTKSLAGSGNVLDVALRPISNDLDEVIVTAGGIQTEKKAIGYASTEIKAESIVRARPINIASGLTGKVPGLRINAVSGGVNPNYRLLLRGMRSLTGNNEALIVLDNVVVPNEILGNLNPDDVDNITVLNGAGAAARYGSDASNGALIITTKRGERNNTTITVSNTTTLEQVAFYPDLQYEFGSGSDNDLQIYLPYENQQFGPKFDGSLKDIGQVVPEEGVPLQQVPYAATDEKKKFWDNGVTNQTDLAISTGDDKGSVYLSGQYANVKGTMPGDKYNRAAFRTNISRDMAKNLTAQMTMSYTQNNYDVTTQTASLYDQLLQTPAQVPVTRYKDWRNDPFSTPDYYYNAYYNNPYFTADNNRRDAKNDYIIGNLNLKYTPLNWLDFTFRAGITSRNLSQTDTQDIYNYSPFAKAQSSSTTYKWSDISGYVHETANKSININSDFLVGLHQKINQDFGFNANLAASLKQDWRKNNAAGVDGLFVPGLFNISNSTNTPTASDAKYEARQVGLWGDVNFSFRDYLFLQITGRNDWVSTLSPDNRSFFYPSVNLSYVASEQIAALKDSKVIDFLKLRATWSKVGNVNLGSRDQFGAYALEPVFDQGGGYPYNGIGGHTLGDQIIALGLKPEITSGYEVGFDANFLKSRIQTTFTWFDSKTKDQTVSSGISSATGYNSYLLNAAETGSKGVESSLRVIPYRNENWEVSVGANYTYYDNKVLKVSDDATELALGTYGGTTGSYAVVGQPFPVIKGTTHERDDQGRIIVDPITGYPSATQGISILGNAEPKHILGLDFSVRFKDFTLSGSAEYRGGYDYYFAGTTIDFSGSSIATTWYNRDRFVIPNSSYWNGTEYVPNTNITVRDGGPAYWTLDGTRTGIDENYIISGAFWKLRELSLGYDLPQKFLYGSRFIQGARISVQGRNLFIWTPKTNIYSDPEYSDGDNLNNGNAIGLNNLGQIPPSRYFGATLSLTF